jgi:hypothetical protein
MPKRTFESTRKSREKGIAVYLTIFFLLAMIPIVGLAIDGGFAFVIRTRLSAAADSAALAAGRGINLASTVAAAQAQATTQATSFFNANFPSGYMNTSTVASTRVITPTFTVNTDESGNPTGVLTISMFVSVQAPTYFMKWLGIPNLTINDSGTATRRNLVMELVLDKSISMQQRPAGDVGAIPSVLNANDVPCQAMVYATIQFLQYFSPYDNLGEISFSYTVFDDYALSTNYWQSGATGLAQTIANLQCNDNTNTTAALYQAWQDIRTKNQKLAQNVIVLFTDGVPNSVNAAFPVRTHVDSRYGPSQQACTTGNGFTQTEVNNSCSNTCIDGSGTVLCTNGVAGDVVCPGGTGCVAGTAANGGSGTGGMMVCTTTAGTVTGVITQTSGFATAGGSRGGLYPMFSTDATPTVPSACAGSSNGNALTSQTIAYIPNSDYFGNSTVNLINSSASSVASYWFQWLYQVNQQCAPNGTPITTGNSSCKNLGDSWTNYATTGAGADHNTFTGGPYKGYLRPDLPNSIGVASMASATSMAYTIRADTTYNPVIDTVYLQGNAGDPVDRAFLQIVSNQQNIEPILYDPTAAPYANAYYQSSQPTGIWAATATTLQLESMFQQIASSLLRISQ